MRAWYGEPRLKASAMERLREHRRMDAIVQRQFWVDGKGCHLGCLTHCDGEQSPHRATEQMFGIETRVAYWLEAVFEGLSEDRAAWWVIEGTDAIPVSADLSRCHHELAYWLLGPDSPSAEGNAHPSVAQAIENVREIHRRAAAGESIDAAAWSAARSAARTAARSAASSAARSAAWSAASSAARSAAESAARSAARSAAWSAASSAARTAASSAAWEAIAHKSIEIFRNAPTPELAEPERCPECVESSLTQLRSPVLVK